jgi:DNA-binding response OmpR family regulator
MTQTILVVDDEERIQNLIAAYLTQEGFRVVKASNGRDALFVAREEKPDLIILDIMMPELDGYAFMREHRRQRPTPIILLTAKIEEQDRVLGLELGADDYVTKPFSPRELTARVRAVLRRVGQAGPEDTRLRVGEIILDPAQFLVTVNGVRVDLTRSEFDLLAVLMAAPGRVFSRSELVARVQGETAVDLPGYERTIDSHVKNLRAKLADDPRQPRFIETVYGVGYRLLAPDRIA